MRSTSRLLVRVATVAALAGAVVATYLPVVGFAFLNWDDESVIVDNPALSAPGVARWAFTTTHMEHYQPVSWLTWAALGFSDTPSPATYHAANMVLHLLVVLLVWSVAREVLRRALAGHAATAHELGAAVAALVYGLHPLRVEVVAWVSAMPYALATLLALGALRVWLRDAERHPGPSWLALLLFVLSLAARPVALGAPVVLVVLDRWLFARTVKTGVIRAAPFLVLAAVAASAEFVARAPGIADAPWAYRLQSSVTAPFVYVWHTLAPVSLTPLDVLPLDPVGDPALIAVSLLGLLGVTALVWRGRRQWPSLLAGWVAYLALLAPAVGLVPSGLQATADRYTYLPGIVLALAVAGAGAHWAAHHVVRGRAVLAGALVAMLACGLASRQALAYWTDSITLWTRVVALNPNNDIGHYNLGVALSAGGRPEAAAERYRAVLALNPAHAEARASLDRYDAARFEQEGNDLAAGGRLAEAAARYEAALARDPRRAHAHAARGMALASLGRTSEAIPHLRQALQLGTTDVAIPNALAGLLLETGAAAEARVVLETAMAAEPNDVSLAHNLARLLASAPGLPADDRMLAFRLAEAVVEETRGQDPRALDTLAASLAAIGRRADARAVNARAAALASAQGQRELAGQITARGRDYHDPGP